jgi:ribA/ribD-fused uncharacterized protein
MERIDNFEGRWSFLSNFYPCEIKYQGIKYPSVEHYYVAMKINTYQIIDGKQYTLDDARELIAKIPTAGQVKRLGRNKLQLRSDWEDVKLSIMEGGLRQKYAKDPLRQMLLDTGDAILIEGNFWHDNFFGSCTCPKCGNKGQNNLGKLLMQIRDEMK